VDLWILRGGFERGERQVDEARRLWDTCIEALRALMPVGAWRTTFEPTVGLRLTEDVLVVGAPSTHVKARVDRRLEEVSTTLAEVGGKELDVIVELCPLELCPQESPVRSHSTLTDDPVAEPSSIASVPERTDTEPTQMERYTFDAFVTGASNRFAHAAALAVAETPGRSFNPLLIYGEAGLGKTHLLHAIGLYVRAHYPTLRVRYVSLEAFMNDFVEAIRTNATTAFKRRYRENDVLLVDDLQFMEGKESLQEEFFYTFNELYGANRQIVLCSDRPPRAIATLERRLRSRFEGGLITDIQPPELETRLAILGKKAHRLKVVIPQEVLEMIATRITNNIRELEGALTRVAASASLDGVPVSVELTDDVLSEMSSAAEPPAITADVVIEATSAMYGFSVDEIRGTSRRRPLVTARQVGMYVCRHMTDLSYPGIARAFGGRDHSTVIYAVEKINHAMHERREIFNQVTRLMQSIRRSG
jgi:chromosomal replication initiator protein